ncbi:MAG: hypothetical protein AAFR05_09800 [Bacteroidota bacterium]
MERCYQIKIDYSQCIDDFMTVHKLNDSDVDLTHLLNSSERDFNQEYIYARANLRHIVNFDFIANDLKIPILSKKFVEAAQISSNHDFDLVDLVLLDDTYQGELFSAEGNPNEGVEKLEGFSTINFKVQRALCDVENSTFMKLRSQPDSPGLLRKVVLRYPEEGFPPIFRIKESISMLFVSQSLKERLEENTIKGCLFNEVTISNNSKQNS